MVISKGLISFLNHISPEISTPWQLTVWSNPLLKCAGISAFLMLHVSHAEFFKVVTQQKKLNQVVFAFLQSMKGPDILRMQIPFKKISHIPSLSQLGIVCLFLFNECLRKFYWGYITEEFMPSVLRLFSYEPTCWTN